jgi:eukaryotic-like serine/threonine-protein kinase
VQALGSEDPQRIGAYALHNRLGSGAMGTVYLGTSPGGRAVAVKIARTELANDPEFRERFRREVEMARSVGGFWTATVVDADPDATRPWLATEYVPGPNLHQAVSEHGPLPEASVRRLAAGLTEALAAIHSAGLVHRDLKPSNVLLGADGPRVIDFGISQALERVRLTATGTFLGTPGFLSPEQIEGGDVGPKSDVFALGAILVYAATGCGPFGDGEIPAVMYRTVHAPPTLTGVPDSLRHTVAACLDHDPARRPAPATLLAEWGTADRVPATAPSWLPAPVQTLVDRYYVQLRDQRIRRTAEPGNHAADEAGAAGEAAGGRVSSTAVVVQPAEPGQSSPASSESAQGAPRSVRSARTTRPGQPTPTRPYTRLFQPSGNGLPPTPADQSAGGAVAYDGTHTGGVRFGPARMPALLWGSGGLVAGLVVGSLAEQSSRDGHPAIAFMLLIGCVLLLVAGARRLYHAARPAPAIEIGRDGLTVTKGRDHWQLPWYAIARTRVVTHNGRPWLAVWLAPGVMPRRTLGGTPLRSFHGGIRLFPIAPERRGSWRAREVREVRAALAWHGPQAYDRSP